LSQPILPEPPNIRGTQLWLHPFLLLPPARVSTSFCSDVSFCSDKPPVYPNRVFGLKGRPLSLSLAPGSPDPKSESTIKPRPLSKATRGLKVPKLNQPNENAKRHSTRFSGEERNSLKLKPEKALKHRSEHTANCPAFSSNVKCKG
jgi:hypothetical protein